MPTATIIRLQQVKPTVVKVQRRSSAVEQTVQTLCEHGFVAIAKKSYNHADTLFTNVIDICESASLIFNPTYPKAHYGRALAAYYNIFATKDELHMKRLAQQCMLDSTVFVVTSDLHEGIDFKSELKDCETFTKVAKSLCN